MPKGCKYIYNNKTYTREEFMSLLAGGEYRNILAEYDQTPKVEAQEGREVVDTVKTFKAKSSVGGKFNVNLFADLTDEQGKTKLDKLREEGYIVDNADVFSFAGSDNVFTMVPDNKMVGDLSFGKEIVYDEKTKQPKGSKDRVVLQGNGGIYFAVKFNDDGTFWASTPQIARSIIKQVNDAIDKNGPPVYVVVSKGSNRKVLSSVDGMIATVDTIAYMVEDGDIPLSVFRNAMSSAVKTSGYTGKDLFPMNISGKDMHKSIKDLFMKAEFSSFEKRKQVVTNLIKNIFDKKSNGDLINFESLGKKLGFPLKNKEDIIDSFGKIQEEGFISEVPSQSAYAVIEIPSKLKLEDESSKDPSERRHIAYAGVMKTVDGQRVKIHMLKDRLNFLDFMTDSKGTPLSDMEERSALGKAGHGQVPFIKAGIKAKASKGVGAGDNSGVPGVGTGRARSNANGNIKTKSRVSASPEQFSNNVAETIDRIKAATSEDGATLNIDGTVYEDGGLVVPAGSVNVSQKGVSAEGLYKFLKDNENNISSDIFKIGLYKFADRAEVSYDLNIVIPREHRDVALEFGKLAGQESLFDLDSYENIKTGSDGKNPITFTPEQLASIAEDLSNGVLPDIEGMLKGTQEGSVVGGDMEATAKALELALKNNPDLIASIPSVFNHSTQLFDSNGKEIKINEFEQGNRIFRVGKTEVKPIWFSAEPYAKGSDIQQIKTLINTNNPFDFNSKEQRDKLEKYAIDKYGNKYKGLSDDIKDGEWDQLETSLNGSIPALIKEMGYDSYYSIEGKQTTVAVFDAAQVKIATPKAIAEAYRKAKTDGTNPELVKAVEQSLKDTQAGTDMQDTGQIVPDQVDVEDKFKQYEKGYNKVQAAEGGAKKRKANEELKNILADSPSAKYIIDNMSYIYKQLEDKGLASKNDQCPI